MRSTGRGRRGRRPLKPACMLQIEKHGKFKSYLGGGGGGGPPAGGAGGGGAEEFTRSGCALKSCACLS